MKIVFSLVLALSTTCLAQNNPSVVGTSPIEVITIVNIPDATNTIYTCELSLKEYVYERKNCKLVPGKTLDDLLEFNKQELDKQSDKDYDLFLQYHNIINLQKQEIGLLKISNKLCTKGLNDAAKSFDDIHKTLSGSK